MLRVAGPLYALWSFWVTVRSFRSTNQNQAVTSSTGPQRLFQT
jgi:hypothetical protein